MLITRALKKYTKNENIGLNSKAANPSLSSETKEQQRWPVNLLFSALPQ